MENFELESFRDEWLINDLKENKNKYGYLYNSFLYLEKYSGEKLLRKWRKELIILSKWKIALGSKIFPRESHEAIIGRIKRSDFKNQFIKDFDEISYTIDSLESMIRRYDEFFQNFF